MIVYRAVEEMRQDEEFGEYTSFGIGAYTKTENREVLYVADVFLSYEKAQALVSLCNGGRLDPIHLLDVIEDAI